MFWINLLIASLAFFMKALDLKGVIAAFVVGTCLLMMDIFSYIILLSFLVLVVIVEKLCSKKGSNKRNYKQVLCNSIPCILFFIAGVVFKKNIIICRFVFSCIVSECLSDSVASVIGETYAKRTYSITTGRRVRRGVSGGVSFCGSLGALLSSIVLGNIFLILAYDMTLYNKEILFLGIVMAGFGGMFIDSIIGDLFQKRYYCTQCNAISDIPEHCKESMGVPISKYRILSNDMVNLITGMFIGSIVMLLINIFPGVL